MSVTTQAAAPPVNRKKNSLSDGQGRLAAMLLSPTLLILVVVVIIPVIMSIRESMYRKLDGVDPNTGEVLAGEPFVGLGNYITASTSASGENVTGVRRHAAPVTPSSATCSVVAVSRTVLAWRWL